MAKASQSSHSPVTIGNWDNRRQDKAGRDDAWNQKQTWAELRQKKRSFDMW